MGVAESNYECQFCTYSRVSLSLGFKNFAKKDSYLKSATPENVAHFARSVPFEAIAANDYNLSVSSYVESEDTREVVDIRALNAILQTFII